MEEVIQDNRKNQHKEKRMGASLQLLKRKREQFYSSHRSINRPSTKQVFKNTPPLRRQKHLSDATDDGHSVLGHTVTADRYCKTVTRLRKAIRTKHRVSSHLPLRQRTTSYSPSEEAVSLGHSLINLPTAQSSLQATFIFFL